MVFIISSRAPQLKKVVICSFYLRRGLGAGRCSETQYDKNKVAAALKDAGIYDKIQSFENGMETKLIKEETATRKIFRAVKSKNFCSPRRYTKTPPCLYWTSRLRRLTR